MLPSLPVRVVQLFVSPGALFDQLREKPRWGWAVLVAGLVTAASMAVIPTEILVESSRAVILERGGEVPDASSFERMGAVQRWAMVGGSVLFSYVWALVMAGVLTFIFAFMLGDDVRYRQYLAVTGHALFIRAIGSWVVTPVRLAKRDLEASLNLGLFIPLDEGFFAHFFQSLEIFGLWTVVVLAIGVSRMARSRGVALPLGLLLTLSLFFAAGVALLRLRFGV